ncbi:uncharacterized protein VTP21DRAFT_2439 [Calcarisporiella thermophila]|uniref:uncharacterized protein n=1 Tax=Calcarisporiella thermophila TaxID=911321 RepID=UPI003742C484
MNPIRTMLWKEGSSSFVITGLSIILALLVVRYVVATIRATYFSPLRKVPGPLFSRVSTFRYFYHRFRGSFHQYVNNLHRQYGPVVILSPEEVSFSQVEAVKQILVTDDFPKGKEYERFAGEDGGKEILTMTDKNQHRILRRMLSPAFSVSYLQELEPFLQSCVQELMVWIRDECERTGGETVFDVYTKIGQLTLDVIGNTSFGGSFHLVTKGSHPLTENIKSFLKKKFMLAMCRLIGFIIPGLVDKEYQYLHSFLSSKIMERRQSTGKHRSDILQILIDAQDKERHGLSDDEVLSQALLFLIAGSETTAGTLFFTLLNLLRHPSSLAKLREELEEAFPPTARSLCVTRHSVLKQLPYLNAVVNEGLRVRSITGNGVARFVNQEVEIGGYLIPPGTTVFANYPMMHLDPAIWGDDAEEFRPERFLSEYPPNAYTPFSAGTRNCIGKSFALMEVRIALASLLLNFEFEEIEGQSDQQVSFVTMRLKSGRFFVRVRPRKHLSL